jgi:hypothetical protein
MTDMQSDNIFRSRRHSGTPIRSENESGKAPDPKVRAVTRVRREAGIALSDLIERAFREGYSSHYVTQQLRCAAAIIEAEQRKASE